MHKKITSKIEKSTPKIFWYSTIRSYLNKYFLLPLFSYPLNVFIPTKTNWFLSNSFDIEVKIVAILINEYKDRSKGKDSVNTEVKLLENKKYIEKMFTTKPTSGFLICIQYKDRKKGKKERNLWSPMYDLSYVISLHWWNIVKMHIMCITCITIFTL